MSRHVFYSLHYDADRTRVDLVRGLAGLVANLEAKPSDWATLKRSGDFAIKRWFEQQIRGRSCTIVLIGAETKTRPWVQHEIARSWALKLGVLGVHVHALKDAKGQQTTKGESPFEPALAPLVQVYDPPETDSKLAYRYIADNLAKWVEKAVAARQAQP
ncbi:MAG: TIR domain-containing protein [Polyangiales bacterium]